VPVLFPPLGDDRFGQELEVFDFAEKMRVVGGNPVNQELQFLLADRRAQQTAVFRVAFDPVMPQPLGQPRGHQRPLVRPQPDAALLVNEAAEKIKVAVRQLKGIRF